MIKILTDLEALEIERALETAYDRAEESGDESELQEVGQALAILKAIQRKSLEDILAQI